MVEGNMHSVGIKFLKFEHFENNDKVEHVLI